MKDKAKSRILEGNIPFVENCHDVTNCDLLGHCISLVQDKGETLSLGRTLAEKIRMARVV